MGKATMSPKPAAAITADMTVREVIAFFPRAADIMAAYGLHCFSCHIGGVETLREAAQIHGFDNETFIMLLEDINEEFAEEPARPRELIITADAARGIRDVAASEGHAGKHLRVMVDEQGGFCMEFTDGPGEGDWEFASAGDPDVKVCVDALTLRRIGGATIDVREGRFKLDMPEECCGGAQSTCACGTMDER